MLLYLHRLLAIGKLVDTIGGRLHVDRHTHMHEHTHTHTYTHTHMHTNGVVLYLRRLLALGKAR